MKICIYQKREGYLIVLKTVNIMLCFLLPITDSLAGSVLQYIVYWTRYWSINRSEFQFISSYNIHNTVSSPQFVIQQGICVYMCLRPHSASLGATEKWLPEEDINSEVLS